MIDDRILAAAQDITEFFTKDRYSMKVRVVYDYISNVVKQMNPDDKHQFEKEQDVIAQAERQRDAGISKLLQCPFCGGEPDAREFVDRGFHRACVRCVSCNSRGAYYTTKAQAVDAWNRRATVDALWAGQAVAWRFKLYPSNRWTMSDTKLTPKELGNKGVQEPLFASPVRVLPSRERPQLVWDGDDAPPSK